MTPKLVNLKYSKGLVLLEVFRNGYRYKGICANQINGEPQEAYKKILVLTMQKQSTSFVMIGNTLE
jgi:hypothetical protein